MAENKLTYQQARKVRKASISDLLLDQLAQQESVGKAIGKTISLKSQARIKGIKEKFDPLNIIRFMTFGSRFAPAVFGKLTGRSQKDIDYFTGRTKSIVGTKNTAEKIRKLSGNGDSEGINEQLAKIYSFLKTSREDDIKLKELAKNKEEEIAIEKEKRHKELLDTLKKLMKSIGSGGQQVTAEKVEESSFLDDLWQKLKGLADIVMMMKDTVLKIAEKLGMQVARGLATAGRWAVGAAQAFAASGGATVAGVVAAGGLITYGATNVLSNMSDEQREQLIKGDVGSDTSLAAAALNSAKSPQEADAYNKAVKKYQDYLSDAPFFTKYYGTKESVGDYLRNVAKIPKKDLDEFEKFELIAPAPTAQPVKKNPPPAPAAPQAPEGMQFDAEGNVNSAPAPQPQPKPKPAPAAPVPAEPKSAPVSNLTNNNINMGLTPIPKSDNMETVTRTTVNNMKNTQGKSGLRPIEISVRNDEPTFMDLIVQSTRII